MTRTDWETNGIVVRRQNNFNIWEFNKKIGAQYQCGTYPTVMVGGTPEWETQGPRESVLF